MALFLGFLFGSAIISGLFFWGLFWLFFKKNHASTLSSVIAFSITSLLLVTLFWFGSNTTKEFISRVWIYPFWTLIFMYICLIFKRFRKSTIDEMDKNQQKAISSFIIGLVALIAWLIPFIGFPFSITGLVFGIQGQFSKNRWMSTCGIILGIIGITLSIINFLLSTYL